MSTVIADGASCAAELAVSSTDMPLALKRCVGSMVKLYDHRIPQPTLMKLVHARKQPDLGRPDPYAEAVWVHSTVCYDFLVGLRALYNPRTYERSRAWAAAARRAMGPDLYENGRFFFQGADTALGYGALRLIPDLPRQAEPSSLIRQLREVSPVMSALLMLDTGDTREQTLDSYRAILTRGSASPKDLDRAVRGLPTAWAARCRRVLLEPVRVQAELATFLDTYLDRVFAKEIPEIQEEVDRAGGEAEKLLAVLPTRTAIERLSGGYTIAPDLSLKRITLAPSVFAYPFVATRVDEGAGDALVVFGVRSDKIVNFEQAPLEVEVVRALKVLSSPARLRVLRRVAERPMTMADLVSELGLSQTTVHHHLVQLRAVGLVRQERTHEGMRHTALPEAAARIVRQLQEFLPNTPR